MALCMFLGFDVSAQYKSLNESKALVENTVNQKSQNGIAGPRAMAAINQSNPLVSASAPTLAKINDIYITKYGNELLNQFKSGVTDVTTAIANADLIFSTQGGGSQRITARQNAAAYFKQLLSI